MQFQVTGLLVHLLALWPLRAHCISRVGGAQGFAVGQGHDPITSFCWGNVTLLGQTVASVGSVKGAVVLRRSTAGAWDWRQHEQDFGDMMAYHHAGIQAEEVTPFLREGRKLVFLSAGVVGVLQLSDATRRAIREAGYELLDLAEGNAQAEAIGDEAFHRHCRAGNLGIQNLSPKAKAALEEIDHDVLASKPLAIRAYTGDVLIMFNKLHEQFPSMEFVGLIHSNC